MTPERAGAIVGRLVAVDVFLGLHDRVQRGWPRCVRCRQYAKDRSEYQTGESSCQSEVAPHALHWVSSPLHSGHDFSWHLPVLNSAAVGDGADSYAGALAGFL